ncbi:hypothetical protein [Halorarius litoreus]|uniref:hypothetical protein n=1 Tax=Halorarius litoreus TaxID=2962676 RepID=UPI0020CDCF7D|nr:hypothetical protein [Halorarius litoreus]
MVPPATVRKLALAVLLLAVGFGLAGRFNTTDVVGVAAFAGGAAVATTDYAADVAQPAAVVPVVVVAALLVIALGIAGFGNAAGLVLLVGCAGLAGGVIATA